jgi:hypothetical protein
MPTSHNRLCMQVLCDLAKKTSVPFVDYLGWDDWTVECTVGLGHSGLLAPLPVPPATISSAPWWRVVE